MSESEQKPEPTYLEMAKRLVAGETVEAQGLFWKLKGSHKALSLHRSPDALASYEVEALCWAGWIEGHGPEDPNYLFLNYTVFKEEQDTHRGFDFWHGVGSALVLVLYLLEQQEEMPQLPWLKTKNAEPLRRLKSSFTSYTRYDEGEIEPWIESGAAVPLGDHHKRPEVHKIQRPKIKGK